MPLFHLTASQAKWCSTAPETAMGLHAVLLDKQTLGFILGCAVLLIRDEKADQQISRLLAAPWLRGGSRQQEEIVGAFEAWLRDLDGAPSFPHEVIPRDALSLMLTPTGPGGPPPPRPAIVYGHLPFTMTAAANDVFYRCEPWPTSRRIDQKAGTIAPGTYACPSSELPFFPTGFAAVGRYALPNVAPACFRWEIQPNAGTKIRCGASVPLYGQAGGGVEVCFDANPTQNRGPIANPVVLPPL